MSRIVNPYLFGAVYTAHAVRFDGTNDYLNRGANLTGLVDGKEGLFSGWLNFKGGDGSQQGVLVNTPEQFQIARLSSNVLRVIGTGGATTSLNISSNSTYTTASGWTHFLVAWRLTTPEAYLYVNDSNDEAAGSTELDGPIDYAGTDWLVGSRPAGADKLNADISDLYWDDSFMDITIEANRRKFIDASGKPVDLGSDGSNPTGSAPLICLNNATTTGWESNKGSGGGFTENGALTDGTDSPSD